MRYLILLISFLLACSTDDPPCSPGDEGLPPGEPPTSPAPGPTDPGPGDFADPAPHGYSRNANGEVCVCDARDEQALGCVVERPSDATNFSDPCAPENYDPESWDNCGNVQSGDVYFGNRKLFDDEQVCCRAWRECLYYTDPMRPWVKSSKTAYSEEYCARSSNGARVDSRKAAKSFCERNGGKPDPDLWGENCRIAPL